MSCILYSRKSYLALATKSLMKELHNDLSYRFQKDFPTVEDFCEALYQANVQAFNDNYEGRYAEEVAESETAKIDSEFVPALRSKREDGEQAAELYQIFGRIEYQLCDAHKWFGSSMESHVDSVRGWLAHEMCAAISTYRQAA